MERKPIQIYEPPIVKHGAPPKNRTCICHKCGVTFLGRTSIQRYCSPECRYESTLTPLPLKTCDHCKQTFRPPRSKSRFCSVGCKWRFYHSKEKDKARKMRKAFERRGL